MRTPSNHFVRLRSPLLRAFADWSDPETPDILRRRRVTIAAIAALAVVLVVLTRVGLLPAPAFDILYLLHDYAALPFWGYTWTLFAPYSITWWSLAAIALVVWVATFLTRRSAVRGLHARLCRVVVHFVAHSSRSPRHVAHLTSGVDWLGTRKLGAELLKDVARLEQTDALKGIVATSSALDESAALRLVRLTDLLAKLTSSEGARLSDRWRSLAIWHQALMWIDRRAGTVRTGAIADLFTALAATGRSLLDRLESLDDAEGDALSSGLRRDLRWLVEYADGCSQSSTAFIASVLERLDDLWSLAEYGSHENSTTNLSAKAADDVIEAQGILVSSIGLHAASRADDMHLAAAYLRAFEAIAFVRYLGTAGGEGTRVARALTAEAPHGDHYRIAADIAERHRRRRATAPGLSGSALDEAAGHERIAIDGLHDAAGPSGSALRALVGSAFARDLQGRLRYRIRHRPLPLRMRVDPVLVAGLAAATLVYGVVTATFVMLAGPGDSTSWSARALPDRRLIENVRRSLDGNPFLDAIFHAPDRQLVVSQAGGVFHSYDPDTGLWSTERPFRPTDLARPEVRLLASSTDDSSGALWGVTANGGLVRRLNGRWEVIVSDTKFLGKRGTPVQQAELSAIAVSSDGRWLLAAAGTEGVGIQDLERRRWLSRDEISPVDGPSAVTHAVWWRDRFYVGGPDGVSELAVNRSPLSFRPVKGLDGAVVALESTVGEGLIVLETVRCENGPSACVRLSTITKPFATPTVLIKEHERHSELSLDRLFYAVQWKEHLLLAGGSGIFDYDARLHAWKRHAAETISAIGGCASSSCFYYGYGGRSSGVSLFKPQTMAGEAPVRWALAGEQPIRIASDGPGAAAVLTAAGRAYALASGPVSTLINPATSAPVPVERYRDAVTFGDKVLFFGRPGALLHDIVTRSYSPLPAVPAWLRSRTSIVAASGAYLFGLEPRGSSYDAYVAPDQQVVTGTIFFNTSKPFSVDGPIRAIDASSRDVLRVIDGHGSVQSIAASGVKPLTGGRSSAMARTRLIDVAGTADVLAASTPEGVRLYSMETRSWSDPVAAPASERAIDIAERKGAWIARSEANRLLSIGAGHSILIGSAEQMPLRPPSDVLQMGPEIYLSWPGTIQRYDVRSRKVSASWAIDSADVPKLAGVAGSAPLSLAGGVARVGSREIARGVHGIFMRGLNLWLTREERGRRYLETRPLASAPQSAPTVTPSCVFRSSTAGVDAGSLHDARLLSNGVVAVTTDAGLKLHSRERHSWYDAANLLPKTGRGTLAAIGSTLLMWDLPAGALAKADDRDSRGTLQIIRSGITLPDSCSTAPARVDTAPDVIAARGVAIDERGKHAYVLKNDGSVDLVGEKATVPMIARESQGPPETDLVRAWHFPDVAPSMLWVATRRGLWEYDLGRHAWLQIAFEYPSPNTFSNRAHEDVAIDLDSGSGEVLVLVRTAASEVYRGTVTKERDRQSTIELTRSSSPMNTGDRRAPSPVFRLGAVTFFRNVSHGMLAILETEDGRQSVAYQNRTFVWDRGRRGIAIGREGALLLTDAGIHAAGLPAGLSSFDPGPPGAPSPADLLMSGPDLVPRMLRGNRWYRRVAAGVWEPASLPSSDVALAEDNGLRWIRRNGSIVVETVAGARRVSVLTGAHGFGLATDQLIDAAAYGTGAALLTPGFVELSEVRPSAPVARGPSTVLRAGALLPAPEADSLDSTTFNSQDLLWLTRSGSVSLWNAERRVFEPAPPGANPLERRVLAESGPLRLTRTAGAIEGALRVADVQGQFSWLPIDLSKGQFPFDVVRSIAIVGNAVYVGTDAGLQVYDGFGFALESARLVTMADNGSSGSAAIDRVGESCNAPGTAVACGPRGCVKQTASTFVDAPADALSCRLRARSPFWSWQLDASGLSGRYVVTPVPGSRASATAVSAVEGPPVSLVGGALSHDDINQVISFDGRTFTVWQRRYVGVHRTGLALAGVRNHAFELPVRLLAIANPVPMLRSRNRDLQPGLYAIEGPWPERATRVEAVRSERATRVEAARSERATRVEAVRSERATRVEAARMWRYGNEEWTIVTDAAETATLADYDANPPLLQRQRLRLARHAPETAPSFEMRMPSATWTPLAWDASANRYAIDVWQDIAVDRETLWIATPAGFVSRGGNWSFNPDTFRVVPGVAAEARSTATDLRVDGSTAYVRYDGARAYHIALDESAERPPVRLERDPFAEQTFDTDAKYWTWRISGRIGASAGRLSGTWKGEPIAVVNGRFDFDAINSMAVFQGQVHIATNTRGWFALPFDSAALDQVSRPNQPSIPPLDVAKLHANRNSDEPELCLQGIDGQFARLSPNGVTRRTQGCPVVVARSGFWRYTRDGSTFRVLPTTAAARPGERQLVDGRFTDEVIIGAPVTGTKNGRSFTLVPTSAGVMWWDDLGGIADMHAPPFQGKPDVPRLLQWTAGGSAAYVADGTLYSLEHDDKPLGSWTVRLPPKAIFERLGNGPGPLLSIDWSDDGRRHHTIVDPRNSSVSHDDVPIDARKIPAYFRRAMTEQSQDGLIRLRLRDHVVSAYGGNEGWPIVKLDDSFQLLAGVSRGTRAILVGPRHLIELNMERIARAVYSGTSPPAPPTAETKK